MAARTLILARTMPRLDAGAGLARSPLLRHLR